MRVTLANVYNDDNRGGCALTWAALDLIRAAFPGADIAVIPIATTPAPAAPFRHTARRYPEVEILPPLFDGRGRSAPLLAANLARRVVDVVRSSRVPALAAIRDSDLVVSCGGVILHTTEGGIGGDARLLIRTLPLLAAQRMGVPVVLLGAQVGPLKTKLGAALLRKIIGKSETLFVRDNISAAEAQRLAPGARIARVPDTAFSLRVPTIGMSHVFDRRGLRPDVPTLALVITSEIAAEEPIDLRAALLAGAARALLDSGLIGQVLVVVQVEQDRDASRRLAALLGLGADMIVDEDLDPVQLASLYSACRLVVSSRLHAVILSLVGGTPAVSVAAAVTFKEQAVLDVVGLGDLCVASDRGAQAVGETSLRVARNHDAVRKRAAAAIEDARRIFARLPDALREAAKRA
jgi:polysaccharide pyruvyl transferase WcaK-like protein